MPLSTPTPPYAEMVLVYEVAGVRCTNRWFYSGITTPVASGEVESFTAQWTATCMTLFQGLSTSEMIVVNTIARLRDTVNLWQDVGNFGVTGGRAGEPPSQQTTANITWDIDGAGGGTRVVRGRTFLTVGSEADVNDGLWSGTLVSDVQDFATALLTPLTFGTQTLTLAIWRPAYLTLAPILGHYVSAQPKVLRSRRG